MVAQHLIDILKQLITQLTHLTWSIGSKLVISRQKQKPANHVASAEQLQYKLFLYFFFN